MKTNTIKCVVLNFVNGIASPTINVPFLVDQINILGLSLSITSLTNPINSFQEAVIFSSLLPQGDNPVGYLLDAISVPSEASSSSCKLKYYLHTPKAVMGCYNFYAESYTLGVPQYTTTISTITSSSLSVLNCTIIGTTLTLGAANGSVAVGQYVSTSQTVPFNMYIVSGSGTSWIVSAPASITSNTLYFFQPIVSTLITNTFTAIAFIEFVQHSQH